QVEGVAAPGRHRELNLLLDEPVAGAAPGQIACLMQGERVIGWATIARPREARDTISVAERAKLHA
ncbi:MAG: hypothetical protein JJE27_04830, partial [Thermoleophilia bacterium]|nr:hypothetical protein [Thermoleophilia bacterium]